MSFLQTLALVASALLMSTASAANQYVAPGLTETLSASSQSYLIGVSSFVIFVVCGLMAIYALTGIDYSGDSLLTVDVEPTVDEQ